MQSLNIFDTVEFVGSGWFAVVNLTNSFKAILLQIGSVGKVADDPSKRVAEVDASRDCPRSVISDNDLNSQK